MSEIMVLSKKRVECSGWVRDTFLHQVKEFKYHRVLLNEGRVEQEICSV